MKAQTNKDYYNILLQGCKEAFEILESKEFLYSNEAMTDSKKIIISSNESIEQIGVEANNNLIVNYQIELNTRVAFLKFLERQQLIFKREYFIERNDFYKRCLTAINIKLTELSKKGHRVLYGFSRMGTPPDPLLFLEYMKREIKYKSLQLIETPEPQQNKTGNTDEVKKTQAKPIKPKKEFKEFFNTDINIEVIEKIQNDFKDSIGKNMAFLIYLLHKEFKVINYSVNSRNESRKHFVTSLKGIDFRMAGVDKYFELNDVKLNIKQFEKDNDYINTKEKLLKAIK